MAADSGRRAQIQAMFTRKETLLQGAVIGLAVWIALGQGESRQFEFFYLLFLPLIWVAARHGMVGAAVAAAVIQTGVIVAVQLVGQPALTVFELQSLLLALALTGYFLGVTVDERERASEELRHSLRLAAAGEMAAALAHELNQPLTALANYAKAAQLLLEAPEQDRQRLSDTLRKLVAESKRAADVVRRLRDFFRTGSTRLEDVAIVELAGRVVDSLRTRAADKQVVLRCVAYGSVPVLLADPLELEVVLRNLLTNAMDAVVNASPETRTVVLDIGVDSTGDITVTVSDNGPGIAREEAERLFEPFLTTKATGMGMGLAISRAIIETHGGRLWIEPGSQGVVRFTLPAHGASDG
jgi:signal transduction histidine kinase